MKTTYPVLLVSRSWGACPFDSFIWLVGMVLANHLPCLITEKIW
jgi:hypothetical protein